MKHLKKLSTILSLTVLLSALSGCGNAQKSNGSASASAISDNSIVASDLYGNEITLDEPADRVVALTASDCEILYAIGAGDTLVGRGEYCDYPSEVSDVPCVQSANEMNTEQIIALDPDVLLISTTDRDSELIPTLEDAGIEVVVAEAYNIEDVYKSIQLIGTLTGKDNEAASIVNDMKATFDAVSVNEAENEGKTVYFEVSPLEYGLWTAGTDTFMNEIAEILGLENAFSDVYGWAEISEEQVIERNPDYIVSITMYYGEGPTPEEEIMNRSGWENITAVKNRAILNLQNNELSRPGPRLADGAQMMYDFISGK